MNRSLLISRLGFSLFCFASVIACSEGPEEEDMGTGSGGAPASGGADTASGSSSSGGMANPSSGGSVNGSGGAGDVTASGGTTGASGGASSGGGDGSGGADGSGGGDGDGSGGADGSGGSQSDCKGYVGITYDDGPVNTDAFVNALEQAGLVPVTFFVNGNQIASKAGAIAKMLTVGEVQSHGYTHDDMGGFSQSQVKTQLEQNNTAIENAGAPKPKIFRPPYGSKSANMTAAAAELGMIVITWDVDSQDWNGASSSAIVTANQNMTNGQVILMHENQTASLNAIPQIAAALSAKGMCPGRLDPTTGKAVAP